MRSSVASASKVTVDVQLYGMQRRTERLQLAIGTIALAVAAMLFGSGCPALMVPGLAYQGYKYEHDKKSPSASSTSAQEKKPTTSPQAKIPDSEIE